jgi:hypothetical protein
MLRPAHPTALKKVRIMDNAQLEKLTVKELRELNTRIETAIRAAIRLKMLEKNPVVAAAGAATPAVSPVDLERERDAWLTARRAGVAGT